MAAARRTAAPSAARRARRWGPAAALSACGLLVATSGTFPPAPRSSSFREESPSSASASVSVSASASASASAPLFARGLAVVAPLPSRRRAASAFHPPSSSSSSSLSSALRSSPSDDDDGDLSRSSPRPATPIPLTVGIVGAGPSGLLLAHRLLSSPSFEASVSIFESRPDPRGGEGDGGDPAAGAALEGRAYALGLNGRSRAAIRSVDDGGRLWDEVKSRGFESDRFVLHAGPKVKFTLRDGTPDLPPGYRDPDDPPAEPSVLIYQSDLCAALLDELERRHGGTTGGGGKRLDLRFGARVRSVDADANAIEVRGLDGDGHLVDSTEGPFDVLAGCGGVNSPVRAGILESAPVGTFACETRTLPGTFKVARLPRMPPKLADDAVALLLPSSPSGGKGKKGRGKKKKERALPTTAFVEPVRDGGACILFAGRGGGPAEEGEEKTGGAADPLLAAPRDIAAGDRGALSLDLLGRFPLLEGMPRDDLDSAVRQLLSQRPARASSVKCNVYHYKSAVLCGDAAHATGGVSGQGVNSAFLDAKVLADCLDGALLRVAPGVPGAVVGEDVVRGAVRSALLSYSQRQVPEGTALYDLSFGAEGELSVLIKLRALLATAIDTVFGGKFGVGKPVLQVQLSSTLRSFADIRRGRDKYFGEKFPDGETWARRIADIYGTET